MDIVKSEINMANEVELCVEVGSNIGDTLLENSDINQLCRTCANTHDNMIPIFEGDGLEHDLQNKIDKHFPVNISKDDGLPNKMCFQCASTLVAWHDMFTGCIEAEKKLKHLLDKLKDDGQVGESVFGSSVVSEDSASDNLKAQQKTGSEMEIDNDDGNDDDYAPEHGGDDDDEDDDDEEEEEEDEEDDDLETEVVLHKLDAKEKEKTVEVSEKGTTIRDQCLRTSSASVSETKPGRKGYSDDCVQKCMMKTLKINLACDECGKKSISDVCVLFHMKQTHERFNVHKCIKCNAAFNCYLKYKIHIEQEHLDCAVGDDDDNSFIQTRRKSRTKQSEVSSNPSVCAEKDQSMISDDDSNHVVGDTYSNDDSDNSEEENTNNKKKTSRSSKVKVMKHYTTCSICTIKCRTTLSLLRHWKDMHTTEEAKLDPKYADIINKRTCNICDEFFTDPRLLKIHKKDDHGFENGISFSKEEEEQLKQCEVILDNSGLKTYKCTFCDMRIESARRFLNHVAKHTGQLPFSCELCDKTFSHGYKLRTHVKVVHEGVKDHKCKFCGKAFGERSNMVQHERSVHTAEPCYSCNICGLTFVSSNRLYFHRRTHTNYKPHQCEECKKNFSRKKHLEAHINVSHRTEKSFVCEICGKLFAVRDSLRSHILTHSDARPHKCSICERAFKTRKNLTRHMESQHSLKNELFTAINSLNEQSQ